jgi:hypothetical protein
LRSGVAEPLIQFKTSMDASIEEVTKFKSMVKWIYFPAFLSNHPNIIQWTWMGVFRKWSMKCITILGDYDICICIGYAWMIFWDDRGRSETSFLEQQSVDVYFSLWSFQMINWMQIDLAMVVHKAYANKPVPILNTRKTWMTLWDIYYRIHT